MKAAPVVRPSPDPWATSIVNEGNLRAKLWGRLLKIIKAAKRRAAR